MADDISDETFARMVNQMGIAKPAQIEAAKAVQAESARKGVLLTLPEVLIQQGIITPVIRENIAEKFRAQQAGGIQMLGPYKLLRKLGEGGMGTVYLADDIYAGRKAAVKILRKKYSEDRSFLVRFRREAQATGRLNHVNIVSAYTVGEEQGLHYFAMEYCDGETLDRILKQRRFIPWDTAVDIIIQAARALKHAHEHDIIHRDIKPANIAICRPLGARHGREGMDGNPRTGARGSQDLFAAGFVAKILDLGVSKTLGQDQPFFTQTGVALGTPHYLSPEQAKGEKDIDGRTDIYSLGTTFYHLVTGVTPFAGSTAAVIMTKHINELPSNPREINADIPDRVAQVIMRMMAKEPADRYADCQELLDDLELVLDGKMPSGQAAEAAESGVDMRPQSRERKGAAPLAHARGSDAAVARSSGSTRDPPDRTSAPDEPELVPLEELPSSKPLYIGAGLTGVGLLALVVALAMIGGGDTPRLTSTGLRPSASTEAEEAKAAAVGPQSPMPSPEPAATNPQPEEAPPKEITAKPDTEKKPTEEAAKAKPTVASPPQAVPTTQPAAQPEAPGKLPGLDGPRDKDGWVYFFNGQSLTGWTVTIGNPLVYDGAIILAGSAALQRPIPETNYELRASVKMVDGQSRYDMSGGIWFPVDGQVQMHMDGDVHLLEAGKLLARSRPGKLAPGEWQAVRLCVLGNTVTLDVEGQTAAKAALTKTAPGILMLAAGGGPAKIAFKDIFVRELGPGAKLSSVAQPETVNLKLETPPKYIRYLSDLPEQEVRVGYGRFGKNGDLGYADGTGRIVVGGKPSPKGLSMHPDANSESHVEYALDGACETFEADAAINDTAAAGPASPLVFRVLGDGRTLWASHPTKESGQAQNCRVDVSGVRKLELVVQNLGTLPCAHAVWLEPRLRLPTPEQLAARALAKAKLEYERLNAESLSLLARNDTQAALAVLELAKADPKLAAFKSALDGDIECAGYMPGVNKAVADGAALLADGRPFTLRKGEGKELAVGKGTKNNVSGLKDEAIIVDQDIGGGAKAMARWRLVDLDPLNRYELARLGMPPGPEGELELAFAGLLMLHSGVTGMTADSIRSRLEAARRGNIPAEKVEHLIERLAACDHEREAARAVKMTETLLKDKQFGEAKAAIEGLRRGFSDTLAAELALANLEKRLDEGVAPGLCAKCYALESAEFTAQSLCDGTPHLFATRIVENLDMPSREKLGRLFGREENIGIRFSGFILVPQEGAYTFYSSSDDGTMLYLGDTLVVANDGAHRMTPEKSGTIALKAGMYPFRVNYWQGGGDAGLIVDWSGPNLTRQIIPPAAFFHRISEKGEVASSDKTPPAAPAQKPATPGTTPAAPSKTSAVGNLLSGTQANDAVKLPGPQTYYLSGDYLVPVGKMLEIECGATIIAESKAQLTVNGTLTISGTPRAPVILRGRGETSGYWKGLKIQGAAAATINYARFSGAEIGLFFVDPSKHKHTASGCQFSGNIVGIKLQHWVGAMIENCSITGNRDDGIRIDYCSLAIVSSTIAQNHGWGVLCESYTSLEMTKSALAGNALGGIKGDGKTKATATQCVFDNRVDVVNTSIEDFDFSRNWWGVANTQLLQAAQTTLPTVKNNPASTKKGATGGMVRLNGFLTKPPEGIGANLEK